MVDFHALRRWGIAEHLLPANSVVLYREPSFWERYRWYALAAGLVLATQTGLIAALLIQSRRRRRAEREAEVQRAELAHASRLSAVGALTASIAHEINQPLAAILSNAEAAELLLEADPTRLEPVRTILADIRREDRRASDVIRHVRSLLAKAPLEAKPLALDEVVRDVVELVGPDAERRGIALETQLAPDVPAVRGDRVHLQQVLLNLVLNGMEALGDAPEGVRRIVVRAAKDGESGVSLAVSDTGPGIPSQHLPRLFDSFFTTKRDGMGLGLSIVHSIVEAHGGRISAENDGGRGATFRV